MRIHRILPATRAEGPGLRFTLWTQGCHNGCRGCYARDLWDPAGGREMTVEALLEQIAATKDIEGVTFLGGEPMEQAGELARLAAGVRELGLSVVTFTGLTYEAILREGDPDRLALAAATDLLIDGPYIPEEHDTSRPWVGSKNQRYRFLTDRYTQEEIDRCHNRVELRLSKDGSLRLNGMGDFPLLEQILGQLQMIRGDEHGLQQI
jgi:anaerobic ribonucleoside-triphosphate reductase activating protein